VKKSLKKERIKHRISLANFIKEMPFSLCMSQGIIHQPKQYL